MGYVKGIEKEAKLAVSYVLKHFYTPKIRQYVSNTNSQYRILKQKYDFDLIKYLVVTADFVNTFTPGEKCYFITYINDTIVDIYTLDSINQTAKLTINCTSYSGDQYLNFRIISGGWDNRNDFTINITELAFFPTEYNPDYNDETPW